MKINSYWTWSPVFNSDTPNQHSLPSQTSSYSLKLWPCSRQTVQHISWSQGCSISPHISESTSQTFIPGVNCAWYHSMNKFIQHCVLYPWISSFNHSSSTNLLTTRNSILESREVTKVKSEFWPLLRRVEILKESREKTDHCLVNFQIEIF